MDRGMARKLWEVDFYQKLSWEEKEFSDLLKVDLVELVVN